MMIKMSFGDAATILAMYLFYAFFMKDMLWLKTMNLKTGVIFFVLGLCVAVAAEYRAVYITHEWQYNNKMPILLGVGLSPFLQLGVTGIISLWLTKRLSNP
jgi:heme/copper-type cytochrome/quinol oxidase subunit 2